MLEVAAKYATELDVVNRKVEGSDWIDFSRAINQGKASDVEVLAPRIILFDEQTGEQLTDQVEVSNPKQEKPPVKLPWREWIQACDYELEPDKASAVAALHLLLDNFNPAEAKVDVFDHDGKIICTSAADAEKHSICIPPCIAKQAKIYEMSEHPYAVKVVQKVMKNVSEKETELTEGAAKQAANEAESNPTSVCRENTFYVQPEWKTVEYAAVAGAQDGGAVTWQWNGKESMHPYWAVRRLTHKQIVIEQGNWKPQVGKLRPRFNCEMKLMSLSAVNLGCINDRMLNRTRMMDVPFLVNSVPLQEKEELLLELVPKEKKAVDKRKRTWKDAVKDAEIEAKKNKEKKQKKETQA